VASAVLYHPDYTVGPGITPDLLTPLPKGNGRSRADALARDYRRWGISPRPENVHRRKKAAIKSIGRTIRPRKIGSFTKGVAHAIVFDVRPRR